MDPFDARSDQSSNSGSRLNELVEESVERLELIEAVFADGSKFVGNGHDEWPAEGHATTHEPDQETGIDGLPIELVSFNREQHHAKTIETLFAGQTNP